MTVFKKWIERLKEIISAKGKVRASLSLVSNKQTIYIYKLSTPTRRWEQTQENTQECRGS